VAAKRSVLGVFVDAVDYDDDDAGVLAAAREHRPFGLTALAVHGVMTGVTDAGHQARLNSFDMVTADGQPVRWALNLLHGAGLPTGSAAPELVMRNLPRMAREGLPVYVYGSPW
jgi:UDP-N-acetyl-D-mannosaminuronic acid transferase (WecB/TagA/CpsF family)